MSKGILIGAQSFLKGHSQLFINLHTGVGAAMIKADFEKFVPKELAKDYAGLYACVLATAFWFGKWCASTIITAGKFCF